MKKLLMVLMTTYSVSTLAGAPDPMVIKCTFENYGRLLNQDITLEMNFKKKIITTSNLYRNAVLSIKSVSNVDGNKLKRDENMVIVAVGAEEDVTKHSLTIAIQPEEKTAQVVDVVLADSDEVHTVYSAKNCTINQTIIPIEMSTQILAEEIYKTQYLYDVSNRHTPEITNKSFFTCGNRSHYEDRMLVDFKSLLSSYGIENGKDRLNKAKLIQKFIYSVKTSVVTDETNTQFSVTRCHTVEELVDYLNIMLM